jgi:hypothetical protein
MRAASCQEDGSDCGTIAFSAKTALSRQGRPKLAPDRRTIVHKKFRLRQKLLRDIERAAKDNDRSVNEEIERRLEASFQLLEERNRLLEDRERLNLLFRTLEESPGGIPPQLKSIAEELEVKAEEHIQTETMDELFPEDQKRK